MFPSRPLVPALLALGVAALLTGCGGGGGGGGSSSGGGSNQTYLGSVTGKVVDQLGNPVASAIVFLDGQAANATATFQQGGYLLTSVTPTFHQISVSTTVSGTTYTGATDVAVPNVSANNLTNSNIIVAPTNEQAPVSGYVRDSNGNPITGAHVSFQTAFAAPNALAAGSPASTAALVAITDSTGYYQLGGEPLGTSSIAEPGLPVLQAGTGGATAPRVYTITASAFPVNGVTYANAPTVTRQFTASTSLLSANQTNFVLPVASNANASGTTPTVNYLLAFTQPDIQAYYPPQVQSASAAAVYEQVRRVLAPKYAQLETGEHAASQIKHLVSAAQPHATANNYTVEMNLFFSLPGDTGSSLSPVRSELSGFNIYNNSNPNGPPSSTVAGYDFLEDPLANYYVDPDLGASGQFNYNEDETYQFTVQGVATDGVTTFLQSPVVSVEPLSLVNLTQPADPNDSANATISTLAADPTFIWSTVDASQPTVPNNHVGSYYVFIYSTFPGVTTTPIYQSSALTPSAYLNGTTETFTPPGVTLSAGQYWVVVAATADDSTATASAVSVSQITPFTVP